MIEMTWQNVTRFLHDECPELFVCIGKNAQGEPNTLDITSGYIQRRHLEAFLEKYQGPTL